MTRLRKKLDKIELDQSVVWEIIVPDDILLDRVKNNNVKRAINYSNLLNMAIGGNVLDAFCDVFSPLYSERTLFALEYFSESDWDGLYGRISDIKKIVRG